MSTQPGRGASAAANADPLKFEVIEGVAEITLNRPEKMNSLNAAMHAALIGRLRQLPRDPSIRAVLLTGSGRAFCAGQDLGERKVAPGDAPRDLSQTIEQTWNPLARALRNLEVPVVCAVNGVAAGAGANIALACDIVLAARSASFIQSFSRIGLIPDAGGTYYLPRLLGTARAMAVAMLAERITAPQAEAWGLIWRVVDDESLMEEARSLVRHLATQPTKGLGMLKKAIYASLDHSFEEQLEMERRLQGICGFTKDYREGVAAFLEKRQPRFIGE